MARYTSPLLNALHTVLVFMHGRQPTHLEMLQTAGIMRRRVRK